MLKSESVWYEEVDRGLKQLVKNVLGDIPVIFSPSRKDSVDNIGNPYKRPSYPYVRILHVGETFDPIRYNRQDEVVSTNSSTVILILSLQPHTF